MSSPSPTNLPLLRERFENPPAALRGKPFWSWNGRLNREELLRQIDVFEEMGMGGFFMHSRTGLATEYLGDEWFDLINTCTDEAARRGMEAWLYDEDRWPSGTAGGRVTAGEHFRMRNLRLDLVDAKSLEWPVERFFIAAFSGKVDGLAVSDYHPISYGTDASTIGGTILLFTWEFMPASSFYNGNTYLDTLQREATEHFIDLTHEKYRERCGERLGTTLRGIFTDEPHRGMVMCSARGRGWQAPYTEKLFGKYEEAYGEDLRSKLPELFLRKDGKRHSRVKWRYLELLQDLFLENWARPLRDWCRDHNLILTGHVLHEDSLTAQAVPCGSLMRYYEFLDHPGIDVLGSRNSSFWVARQLQSVSRQMGVPWLISELYGCSGWQTNFADHKRIGDWQAVMGINVRCHHLSWVTMEGESKRDYPASIFFQSSWFREYSVVETYFSRLHALLQFGSSVCDVLVLSPIESVWAQIHVDWAKWLESDDPDVDLVEQRYHDLFHWLTGAQIDFDYGDEDHLARFGAVTSPGVLDFGQASYRTIIVGGMETIRSSSLRILEDFRQSGGNLIFVGEPPALVDVEESPAAHALSGKTTQVPFSEPDVLAVVRSQQPLSFTTPAKTVLCQMRREGDICVAVFTNTSAETSYPKMELVCALLGSVQEWDALTGRRYAVPATVGENGLVWKTSFDPLQERAFVIGLPEENLAARPRVSIEESSEIDGPFAYRLSEPNLCVLDMASWRIGDGAWSERMEILQIDEVVRHQLGLPQRSGEMMQPWAWEASHLPTTPLTLRFEVSVETPASGVELMLEQPDLARVLISGHAIEIPASTEWLIDPCFRRIPIPPLPPGENTIEIELQFSDEIALEAIYLLGQFGVELRHDRPVLTQLPEKLATGDICAQGLPFYSGKITYSLPLPAANPERAQLLEIEPSGAAAVTFRATTGGSRIVPWKPFAVDLSEIEAKDEVEVELALVRHNTFGPLHLAAALECTFVSPQSFRSKGKDFTSHYQLIPSGIMKPPLFKLGARLG